MAAAGKGGISEAKELYWDELELFSQGWPFQGPLTQAQTLQRRRDDHYAAVQKLAFPGYPPEEPTAELEDAAAQQQDHSFK